MLHHQDQPSSFWSQLCGSSEDNIPSLVLEGVKMSHCLPCTCRHLWGMLLLFSRSLQGIILKEINPEDLLEGLVLKPNLQYFGHLI